MRSQSVAAANTIEELRKRFKPENARNLTATYLFIVQRQRRWTVVDEKMSARRSRVRAARSRQKALTARLRHLG